MYHARRRTRTPSDAGPPIAVTDPEPPVIRIHDSLTGERRPLVPIEPGHVRMYVCGMTVYDYCHVGHARVMVVFDMVVRYLRARGLRVTYVRNVTDIDDKIIRRAAEAGIGIDELTQTFTRHMHEDAEALGTLPPDVEPRATAHVDDIVAMVARLIERNHAYLAGNGDVYYAVKSFPGYGRLSGKKLEELQAGARVEVGEAKRDPLDFVLWKAAKPGEPAWPSPWGDGRPGWHIECSAMSTRCLGNHFDIHGGGQDLQFPHHENEIAQSEGATGERFVEIWMHNGFVRVAEEKMSKSLGNFFTVREVLRSYRPEELRFFILASHYRSPLNYGPEGLDAARSGLARLYTALRGVPPDAATMPDAALMARFHAAMADDFNTPEAFAVLFDAARELNRAREAGDAAGVGRHAATLAAIGRVLGILAADPDAWLQGGAGPGAGGAAEIESLIAQRNAARGRRDWAEADRIRKALSALGVVLEDGPGGTSWRRQ